MTDLRIGYGYDVHRLVPGRALVLGGVTVPFEKGLLEGQYAYEKLTVDAALEGSYQKALMALTVSRTVGDAELARTLLDEYIAANGEYFPKLV